MVQCFLSWGNYLFPKSIVLTATLAAVTLSYFPTESLAQKKPTKSKAPIAKQTKGPNACAECHKEEAKIWKKTQHFKTFRELPRSKAARDIAKRLKIKRIKSESLCLNCHFTSQQASKKKVKVIAGISCESCHGAGKKYIDLHSSYSGKTKETESEAEKKSRWKSAENNKMIRPGNIYRIAKNCFGCHIVPFEKLINVGKHPAGSSFDLVSWSQGEIRHNLWHQPDKGNREASIERRRIMYLVGLTVEIESSIRAVAVSEETNHYSVKMAHRVDQSRKKFLAAYKLIPKSPELEAISVASYEAGLKLDNRKALTQSADKIASQIQIFLTKHDGKQLGAMDALLPKKSSYVGRTEETN